MLPIDGESSSLLNPLPGDRDLIRARHERLLEEQRRRIEELH
ncbi:hypothetical protein [Stutzerimonas frequens]|nr:hypothetical protein [Stutzerimonas frequens]MDA0425270.1 hypothetical protein [Stutzerimonas frequens]